MWEQTGSKPDALINLSPDIPEAGFDLWNIFWDLKTGENITWSEVESYSKFYGISFDSWEISTLMTMNAEYNKFVQDEEVNKPRKEAEKNQKKANPRKRHQRR